MGFWEYSYTPKGLGFDNSNTIVLLVFTLLPFVALLIIATFVLRTPRYDGDDKALRRAAFSPLGLSVWSFIVSFGLKSLDVLLVALHVSLKYGYYFTYAFTEPFFGTLADIQLLLVVWGMYRYIFPVKGKQNIVPGFIQIGIQGLLIVLLALALFQWSLAIAEWTVYLNATSPAAASTLNLEYERLLAAYNLLYVIISGLMWGTSLTLASTRWIAGVPAEEGYFLAITSMLVIRSMAVAISQILYGLQRRTPPDYHLPAIRAIYGLLSIGLYYLAAKQSAVTSSSSAEYEVLVKSLRNARKDLDRRRYDAAHGGPPYPASSAELLGELKSSPLKYFSEDSLSEMRSWHHKKIEDLVSKHTKKVLRMR